MTREEAEEHAKKLKEFCRDRDNLDEPCEDCLRSMAERVKE